MGLTVKLDPRQFQFSVKQLKTRIGKLDGASVQAGFIPDGNTQTGPKFNTKQHADNPFELVLQYAIYNEFGTSRIPSRPFMRTAAAVRGEAWLTYASKILQNTTLNADQALDAAGQLMVSDIRASITGAFYPWPANAPSTLKKKLRISKAQGEKAGAMAAPPLIDTGSMIKAVGYKVERK